MVTIRPNGTSRLMRLVHRLHHRCRSHSSRLHQLANHLLTRLQRNLSHRGPCICPFVTQMSPGRPIFLSLTLPLWHCRMRVTWICWRPYLSVSMSVRTNQRVLKLPKSRETEQTCCNKHRVSEPLHVFKAAEALHCVILGLILLLKQPPVAMKLTY